MFTRPVHQFSDRGPREPLHLREDRMLIPFVRASGVGGGSHGHGEVLCTCWLLLPACLHDQGSRGSKHEPPVL